MECQPEVLPPGRLPLPPLAVAGAAVPLDSRISPSRELAAVVRRLPPVLDPDWFRLAEAADLLLPGGRVEARRSSVHTPDAKLTGLAVAASGLVGVAERNPGRRKEGAPLALWFSADLVNPSERRYVEYQGLVTW